MLMHIAHRQHLFSPLFYSQLFFALIFILMFFFCCFGKSIEFALYVGFRSDEVEECSATKTESILTWHNNKSGYFEGYTKYSLSLSRTHTFPLSDMYVFAGADGKLWLFSWISITLNVSIFYISFALCYGKRSFICLFKCFQSNSNVFTFLSIELIWLVTSYLALVSYLGEQCVHFRTEMLLATQIMLMYHHPRPLKWYNGETLGVVRH